MEEATSWKNHTFTLLIFGGIIVLCAIFFVLGMVVGRAQGRQIAAAAFEAREAKRTPADIAEDTLKLEYPRNTTGENPGLSWQPDPPPAPREEPAKRPTPPPSRAATPPPPKPPAPPAAARGSFLQVYSTKDEKQARAELKRVELKGFEASILEGYKDKEKWFRVVAGPYKESELSLRKKDLAAKGYKGAFVAK
jgi:cell division protein FtsN